jgi:hypothetical protein
LANTLESVITPEELVSETSHGSTADGDYLIRAFFDTLGMIQTMLSGDEERKTIPGVEGYTTQLLSDFVRVLFLANKSVLGKCERGQVQIWYVHCDRIQLIAVHLVKCRLISMESDMWFYMMDLCPSFLQRTMHITFLRIFSRRYPSHLRFAKSEVVADNQASHSQLNGDDALERDGQIVAQLVGSLLNTAFSLWGKEVLSTGNSRVTRVGVCVSY